MRQFATRIFIYIQNSITWILPAVTAGCILLLIASYRFPNQVLDTYTMNMEEEDDTEKMIPLNEGKTVSLVMNTGMRPLKGIQVGINKQGGIFLEGAFLYCVYGADNHELLSSNSYNLSEGLDLQYVYLPLTDYEKCDGDIIIEFSYDSQSNETETPALMANELPVEGVQTLVDGKITKDSLKGYYVYTHNTYPFVYDLKICVFFFFAVSMAVDYSAFGKKKKGGHENEK